MKSCPRLFSIRPAKPEACHNRSRWLSPAPRDDTTGGTPTTTPFTYDHGNNAGNPDPVIALQGNGNIVNDGIRIYQYDAFNRLIQVNDAAHPDNVLATYVYDAMNRRVSKTISNGGLTGDIPNDTYYYFYDGLQMIQKQTVGSSYAWGQIYFWGRYVDELLFLGSQTGAAPAVYRIMSDLLYRSTALVDTSNNIIEVYDTDAYGNTLMYDDPGEDGEWFTDDDVQTDDPTNSTIFTGRRFDIETQLYDYRARYYSPNIGRFLSRDPLQNAELSQGANLYWYVANNPPNSVDPRGTDCCNGAQYDPTTQCCSNGEVVSKSIFCPCGEDLYLDFHNASETLELTDGSAFLGSDYLGDIGLAAGGTSMAGALGWVSHNSKYVVAASKIDPPITLYTLATQIGAIAGSWRCMPIPPPDKPDKVWVSMPGGMPYQAIPGTMTPAPGTPGSPQLPTPNNYDSSGRYIPAPPGAPPDS